MPRHYRKLRGNSAYYPFAARTGMRARQRREVRALRAQGIRVAAVFMGENTSVPAANAIYGRDLARIRRIDQLAAAAGRLIQDEIRELSG